MLLHQRISAHPACRNYAARVVSSLSASTRTYATRGWSAVQKAEISGCAAEIPLALAIVLTTSSSLVCGTTSALHITATRSYSASSCQVHSRSIASQRFFSTAPSSTTSTNTRTAAPIPPASSTDPSSIHSNADEKTDAEAGLNETVKKSSETKAANASASASATASTSSSSKSKQDVEDEAEDAAAEEKVAEEKKKNIQPITWSSFLFLLSVGGSSLAYFLHQQDKQLHTVRTESIGTPLLGGPWSLTNDANQCVTSESLHGKYVMMYFGFTFCPDICPKELDRLGEVIERLQKLRPGTPFVPIFISLDPKRDTPARLASYKTKYHPQIQWLTGTDAELADIAKAFRIYYSASETLEGEDDDYLIDHSTFFYLMDREGKFAEFFSPQNPPEDIAVRTAAFIGAENKRK